LGGQEQELSAPRSLKEKIGQDVQLSIVPMQLTHRYEHSSIIYNYLL